MESDGAESKDRQNDDVDGAKIESNKSGSVIQEQQNDRLSELDEEEGSLRGDNVDEGSVQEQQENEEKDNLDNFEGEVTPSDMSNIEAESIDGSIQQGEQGGGEEEEGMKPDGQGNGVFNTDYDQEPENENVILPPREEDPLPEAGHSGSEESFFDDARLDAHSEKNETILDQKPNFFGSVEDLKFGPDEKVWPANIDEKAGTEILLPPVFPTKPMTRPHDFLYRPAARYLRNPFWEPPWSGAVLPDLCKPKHGLSTASYAGPDKRKTKTERRWARRDCYQPKEVTLVNPNPTATVPMRPRKWKKMTWQTDPPKQVEEWREKEEALRAKRQREKAHKLGYETLVGNLVYCDIPGAKDLNRSWKHFLDQDPMAWGFPRQKGCRERPSRPLPKPYLVHQLKESLWKYPRNKLIVQSKKSEPYVDSETN